MKVPVKMANIDRLMSRVDKTGDCWEWTGGLDKDGYGRLYLQRGANAVRAHRFSYEYFVGPIPVDKEIDHLCHNRKCVKPEHLEAVTHRENIRRAPNHHSNKTHCVNGHDLTSVEAKSGFRRCRECGRAQWHKTGKQARKRRALIGDFR